ncbi:MAG TPA: hypothetical protein VIJ14_09700 [Rhabdochlamydiaceae bacterium]
MTNNLTKKLEDFFKNPTALSMPQMEEFIHETIKFFDHVRTTMETGTEEEKKEAIKESQELQEKLQKYSKQAYEKTGMSEEEVKKLLEKGNFPASDFRLYKNAQREIDEFREKATPKPKTKHHEKWGKKI